MTLYYNINHNNVLQVYHNIKSLIVSTFRQHLTLNTLLKCYKSINKQREQICDLKSFVVINLYKQIKRILTTFLIEQCSKSRFFEGGKEGYFLGLWCSHHVPRGSTKLGFWVFIIPIKFPRAFQKVLKGFSTCSPTFSQ